MTTLLNFIITEAESETEAEKLCSLCVISLRAFKVYAV